MPRKGDVTLEALRKLGPASRQMLIAAGIESDEQLRALGAVRAYLAVKRANARASLNLLWALEGVLTGKHWRVVAREDRTGLLLQLDDAAHADAQSHRTVD
jgi:DNA transformation protein and related proteins